MKYNPANFGVITKAKHRSKSRADVSILLGKQNNQCWADFHFPGSCPQHGKKLVAADADAAHITPYSKGGNDFVALCKECNQLQGRQHLRHFSLILLKLQKEYHDPTLAEKWDPNSPLDNLL